MSTRGWVGFDFDNTLVRYDSGDASRGIVGQPIKVMVDKAKALLARRIPIRIVTARVSGDDVRIIVAARAIIEEWCIQHLGQVVPVTCSKDYNMICIYDDRAIAVEPGTGRILGGEEP